MFGIDIFQATTSDSVSHFAPMLLTQFITAIWVSEGRMLPIMSDVQQLLIAPEIMRAVASAMLNPKEKTFKVTAKGTTRDKTTIHWHLICRFWALIFANVFGISNLLLMNNSDWVADGTAGTLFWTWYNLVVLIICCLVCVEQPRHRKHERYEIREKALVKTDRRERYFVSRDVSVGGMSFEGPSPDLNGGAVQIRFLGWDLIGLICRQDKAGFAVIFTDEKSREAMTNFIYNEAVCKDATKAQLGKMVARVVNRAVG